MHAPRDPVKRRRLIVLLVLAAGAGAAGIVVGAGSADEPGPAASATTTAPPEAAGQAPARAPASGGAAQREAGAAIVLRFRGTTAPAYVLRALRRGRVAGVILFADNVVSPAQLRRMTRALHRAAGGRALVMTDQEGGAIRNVRWAAPATAPPGIATTAAARTTARATARDLRALGVTINLAPVADLGYAPGSVMRTRAFPGGAAQVSRLVAATVRAYAGTGVLPTVKHFPGLGGSTRNTDFRPATVGGRGDLGPFAAALEAGAPLVMTSHALYPQLDPDRIASQSRRILTGLLRERLGFEGVVITDSLEAQAVVRRSSTWTAAVRSLLAGSDLLLTTGRGSYIQVLRRLVADARRSPAVRARLREAGERVRVLRDRLE